MTFLEYLNSIRMENLFMDLMDTDLSIQQLLSIHGFTNYKLFMKMFRARYGTTPNELRKSSRPARSWPRHVKPDAGQDRKFRKNCHR